MEYSKEILELLRIPMEKGEIAINRNNLNYTFPCKFMLVAAMNPCNCGNYGDKYKICTCTENSREKYFNKISGPIMDRFDITINVQSVRYNEISEKRTPENSEKIKQRVNKARKMQQKRFEEHGIFSNTELTNPLIQKFCKLDETGEKLLKNAFDKMNLSARGYNKILKVARTIADLDGKEDIEATHVAEAINYRDGVK